MQTISEFACLYCERLTVQQTLNVHGLKYRPISICLLLT